MAETVTYWEDWDFGGILATREPSIFVWLAEEGRWIRVNPRSDRWDYYHQKIFRAHRAYPIEDERIGRDFPELPDPPPEPEPLSELEQKHLASSFPADDYLLVAAWLAELPDQEVQGFVLLQEDNYETMFGDGCFRDMEGIALTEEAAHRFQQETPKGYGRYCRAFRMALRNARIEFPEIETKTFDRHTPYTVLMGLQLSLAREKQGGQ